MKVCSTDLEIHIPSRPWSWVCDQAQRTICWQLIWLVLHDLDICDEPILY